MPNPVGDRGRPAERAADDRARDRPPDPGQRRRLPGELGHGRAELAHAGGGGLGQVELGVGPVNGGVRAGEQRLLVGPGVADQRGRVAKHPGEPHRQVHARPGQHREAHRRDQRGDPGEAHRTPSRLFRSCSSRSRSARAGGRTWDRSLLFPTAGLARLGVRGVAETPVRPAVPLRMQDLADKPGPFGETGLHAVTRGLIVRPAVDRVRCVLLADDALGPVVRVDVALAVAEALGPGVVRVAQVVGDRADQARLHVRLGGADRLDHRVRLGREGDVDHRLGEVDPRLGQADELDRLRGRDRRLQRGRVGHPDVLAGVHDQPPGDEPGVLARLEHPGQVVQRRVGVAAAHRLDEGADDVVVLVAVAVVADGRPVHRALQRRRCRCASVPRAAASR